MLSQLYHRFSKHLGFSSKEANGFVGLILLLTLIFSIPHIAQQWIHPEVYNPLHDQRIMDSVLAQLSKSQVKHTIHSPKTTHHQPKQLQPFNPNTASKETLLELGITAYAAKSIINYRTHGGKFLIKKDLQKIYGMNEEQYQQISPYILLPDSLPKTTKPIYSKTQHSIPTAIIFDINTADTNQLKQLRGIGSKLAQRIIKYRNALGGFVYKKQYQEIYGLDSTVVELLIKNTVINNSFQPQKIKLNTCTVEALDQHPYLNKKEAQIIINYRNQHQAIRTVQDLQNIKALSSEKINAIMPYLEF